MIWILSVNNKKIFLYKKIEVFEETFPAMENLSYLNLRENKFEKLEEF
jgi:hypothetical protein